MARAIQSVFRKMALLALWAMAGGLKLEAGRTARDRGVIAGLAPPAGDSEDPDSKGWMEFSITNMRKSKEKRK